MTTGQINPLEFISIRPDENTRSIVEIDEEIRNNGFSNLTDTEIQLHIEYEKKLALEEQRQEFQKEQTNAQIEELHAFIEKQKELRDERRREENNGQA